MEALMFESFIGNLKFQNDSPYTGEAKRRHERRTSDSCVTMIESKLYPVENWSPGGLQIFADSRLFAVGNEHAITLKFKMRDQIIDVPHRAKVVRRSGNTVAFQFLPLTQQIRRGFQSVIDDYLASKFTESQMV